MICLFLALASSALISSHEERSFVGFMRTNGVFYTGAEYHFRLGLFLANTRFIHDFNLQKKSFKLGANRFAAYTPAEYRALLGLRSGRGSEEQLHKNKKQMVRHVKIPAGHKTAATIDWRTEGVVNPIKDQGQCAAGWAFSLITSQESTWAINQKQLYVLSEQNLVDCACFGCSGGTPVDACTYVSFSQSGKLNLASEYPYEGVVGQCRFKSEHGITYITGWYEMENKGNEEDLAGFVSYYGVPSVCIDASHTSFQLYSSGIYDESQCSSEFLDHAVGLVGYGTDGGIDYWIVRNSWSESWGENGYIRMIRNKNNQCGIASQVIVPFAL